MTSPLRTPEDYELFLYTLGEQFPSVRHSTVTFVRQGSTLARVAGKLSFDCGVCLVVRERVVFDRLPVLIESYGYEIWHDDDKLCWYDSQPHPDDPDLHTSDPHHKHIPPEIKTHRIPAPDMSFTMPNLSMLIQEVADIVKDIKTKSNNNAHTQHESTE